MLNINIVNKIYRKANPVAPRLTDNAKHLVSVLNSINTRSATRKELVRLSGFTVDMVRYCMKPMIEAGVIEQFLVNKDKASHQYTRLIQG
jgi:hypothetical protein